MGAAGGWYPDPWRPGASRWWDGSQWTAHVQGPVGVPPGWYPDPAQPSAFRWWDGWSWTEHSTAVASEVRADTEPTPTFPFAAGLWAVVGIAASITVGQALATWVPAGSWASPGLFVAAFYAPIYGGIAATCLLASRRFGSRSLVSDFGWRWRVTDIWRGIAVWLLAGVASVVAALPWLHNQTVKDTGRVLRNGYAHLGSVAVVEFAFFAVVCAPLLEELAFRGVLLRAFSERVAVPSAITLQAVLFGLYHFTPGVGPANVPLMVGRAAIGAVFGIAAARWKRLGPGIVAHMIFNAVFVLSVLATR